MTNRIHPSAIVHPTARLGEHNVVGPWVVIGPGVVVGDRNWFGPGACVGMVGDAIGSPSTADEPWWEATSHHGHGVVLGNGIVLKEYVSVQAGSHRPTTLGNGCYLMPKAHLGHDCWLGDEVQLSPGAQIAGHVAIGRRAIIGMGALVHQHAAIAPAAMVGMGAVVRGVVDVARTVVGDPARVAGLNLVGVARWLGIDAVPREVSSALKRNDPAGVSTDVADACVAWQSHIAVR